MAHGRFRSAGAGGRRALRGGSGRRTFGGKVGSHPLARRPDRGDPGTRGRRGRSFRGLGSRFGRGGINRLVRSPDKIRQCGLEGLTVEVTATAVLCWHVVFIGTRHGSLSGATGHPTTRKGRISPFRALG